ncbi:hypothetical protein [Streptomyces sp. AC1-42T]|nr:hypothetical protein [Streptomyces sp. AC1-42T]PZT72965.1 hypothetical protein DNK55_29150 [Streptomyces sp. AC1-42T]PZT83732.1 hypothetical protein DNK56_02420 [Streptomyces sp. AC1-42W]
MTTVARPAAASSAATATDRNQPRTAAPAQPATPPSVHMRALLTWIAVFGALTVVQMLLGPYVKGFPMLLRTLVITGIVVPAVVYTLMPNLLKVRAAVRRRLR